MALKFLTSAVAAATMILSSPAIAASPARGAPESFADLAERLSPAVVNISSAQKVKGAPAAGNSQLQKKFSPQAVSLGSGFIIDAKGIVVTNNHVIDNADQVTVTMHDGREFKAAISAVDRETDIAVLQLELPPTTKLPFVNFGNSNAARVGDWVIAIGNPFGLGGTVTVGIISARNRDIDAGNFDDFIQTDAAINRGNSGGPLFDLSGRVVGINTAIYSQTGGSVGVGFAVPADLASIVVDQLLTHGETRRGWLGVSIDDMTPKLASELGLERPRGAVVSVVRPNSPALSAGRAAERRDPRFQQASGQFRARPDARRRRHARRLDGADDGAARGKARRFEGDGRPARNARARQRSRRAASRRPEGVGPDA